MREATREERQSIQDYINSISQRVLTIPIPEDATNGDVIKAMFPNMEITRIQANCVIIQMVEPFYISCAFSLNWWNAKYKRSE